ncbi:MAG: hypothetical protein HY914_03800 [Desulfomonile tiedjei]|nr:hypothetical protein [Desulfomonile tiedjei]
MAAGTKRDCPKHGSSRKGVRERISIRQASPARLHRTVSTRAAAWRIILCVAAVALLPSAAFPQAEVLEFQCQSCGYRQRFLQGCEPGDVERNIQHVIVVCERANQIRTITVPLDPKLPVKDERLLARQYGFGQSELLGLKLPRFLVPGNTCPLFPISAYLERNVCPIDGSPGMSVAVVMQY